MSKSLPPLDIMNVRSPFEEMIRFIHDGSADEFSRVMAATAEVFSLCQLAGRGLIQQPSGYLAINLSGTNADALYQLAIFNNGYKPMGPPDLAKGNTPDPDRRKDLLESMRKSTELYLKLHKNLSAKDQQDLNNLRIFWGRNKDTVFGTGRTDRYASRWDEQMGLITDGTDSIVLLLDGEEDWELFRNQVKHHPDLLDVPLGCGESLAMVRKVVCVAGSLQPEQFDDELLSGILKNGLPIIPLPHAAVPKFEFLRSFSLQQAAVALTRFYQKGGDDGPSAVVRLPTRKFPIRGYERILRERTRHLPSDYAFYLSRTIRELGFVCHRISRHLVSSKADSTHAANLSDDLHHMSMRGLLTGVAILAWHGWGFDVGISREKVSKLLSAVRSVDTMTVRDLQRKLRDFSAVTLRAVLDTLAAEGLVEYNGNAVKAVAMRDFVEGIPARLCFPPLELATTTLMDEIRRKDLESPPLPFGTFYTRPSNEETQCNRKGVGQ